MGYYTTFSLSTNPPEVIKDVLNCGVQQLDSIFDIDGKSFDSSKWYGHEEDMRIVSDNFPDVLFTLKGEGEEAGDVWIKYFKNGMMQSCYAKLVFEEYDESKLR